jgi:hypothetical protein
MNFPESLGKFGIMTLGEIPGNFPEIFPGNFPREFSLKR